MRRGLDAEGILGPKHTAEGAAGLGLARTHFCATRVLRTWRIKSSFRANQGSLGGDGEG